MLNDYYNQFYLESWRLMSLGERDRKSDFRTAFFSTFSEDFPQIRTVVIRTVDQNTKTVIFHTDNRSRKVNQIKDNSHCSLLFYSKNDGVQLRLSVKAKVYVNCKVAQERWDSMTNLSKRCYIAKKPGSCLKTDETEHFNDLKTREPNDLEALEGFENFSVVECEVQTIDYLSLNFEGHTRIAFDLHKENLVAQKVAP